MSPFIHDRIYPEIESSGLVGYTLRVLIDPRIVRDHWRSILDIDTLRIYLRNVESPCRIVLLLGLSNTFMTFAWYGHLKNLNDREWYTAALLSWGIALFEYMLQVPANRIGYTQLSLPQLKIVDCKARPQIYPIPPHRQKGRDLDERYKGIFL